MNLRRSRFPLLLLVAGLIAVLYCDTAEAQLFRFRRAKSECNRPHPTCHQQQQSQPRINSSHISAPHTVASDHSHNGNCNSSSQSRGYSCHCHGYWTGSCNRECLQQNFPVCLAACSADPTGASCFICLGGSYAICCNKMYHVEKCHCHYSLSTNQPRQNPCSCAPDVYNGCDDSIYGVVQDGKVKVSIIGYDVEFPNPGIPEGERIRVNVHRCGRYCTKGARAELYHNGVRVQCYTIFGDCDC